jgi:hypothetical protein
MRIGRLLAFVFSALAFLCAPLVAQTIVTNVNALRAGTVTAGTTVLLAGYVNAQDGGGGMLYSITGSCAVSGSGTASGNTISITSPHFPFNELALNMYFTGFGATNDPVTGFNATSGTITLLSNVTTTTTPTPFSLNGDNGGTIFVTSSGVCWYRASQTYSQAEWGAYSDGATDDTPALQNWLDANQPHIAVPGNSMISNTLYCGTDSSGNILTDGTIIQGSPATSSGADGQPTFLVTANDKVSLMNTWGGGPAMFVMNQPNKVTAAVFAVDASSAGNAVAVTEF